MPSKASIKKEQWGGERGGTGTGGSEAPTSFTLTRDTNGDIETLSPAGANTWTISRNADRSIASLTNTTYVVTINRDGSGILTGVTVT